jgi:REP element-mobilizing transposase RayT
MKELASEPMILDARMRAIVEESIKALCSRRDYFLQAENVRTNHVHAVISAARKPERIVVDLKANATRMLREAGLVSDTERVWSRGMSTKYLWKPRHVSAAVHYVLYCQGDEEFVIND